MFVLGPAGRIHAATAACRWYEYLLGFLLLGLFVLPIEAGGESIINVVISLFHVEPAPGFSSDQGEQATAGGHSTALRTGL